METANPGCDAGRPAPGTAAKIKAFGIGLQLRKGEDSKRAIEQLLIFTPNQSGLVECRPFRAKPGHRVPIDVRRPPLWINQCTLRTSRIRAPTAHCQSSGMTTPWQSFLAGAKRESFPVPVRCGLMRIGLLID